MLVTIFTPTYNRADTLPRLYESLKNQKCKDFQWAIVDDGSTDNTPELLKKFEEEGVLNIIYISTENGGKMRAINRGLKLAQGKYFFIVDSDDYITDGAIEEIEKVDRDLPENFGGMVFRKMKIQDREITGGAMPAESMDSTPLKIFYRERVLGDKAEVIKTEVMREFPFPEFPGEKFVPEGYIWNRIGERYPLRYIDRGIYLFEYLEGGYTKDFKNVMKKNPRGFKLYYGYMLKQDIPLVNRIKFFIRYLEAIYYTLGKKE